MKKGKSTAADKNTGAEEIKTIKKLSKEKVKKGIIDWIIIILGCVFSAYSAVGILVPYGLTSGGITGISRMLQTVIPLDFTVIFYAMSLLIFLLCLILLGWGEAKKIALMAVLFPAIQMMVQAANIRFLDSDDTLLAVIYCGVLWGLGNGLMFSRGYSSGGTDTLAKIIKMRFLPHIAVSKILLGIDGIIIIASIFVFGRNIALYAIITTIIVSKVTDVVLYGFSAKAVQVEIITSKPDEISEYIMAELKRGVSKITITGAYTYTKHEKLVTICSQRESTLIRRFVAETDRKAFVTMIQVDGVWGKGVGFGEIDNFNS